MKSQTPNPWNLTQRQCEVIALVVEGNTAKQVARALGLSPKTIEVLMYRVRKEMNVHSALMAALKWDRHFRPNGDSSGAPASPAIGG